MRVSAPDFANRVGQLESCRGGRMSQARSTVNHPRTSYRGLEGLEVWHTRAPTVSFSLRRRIGRARPATARRQFQLPPEAAIHAVVSPARDMHGGNGSRVGRSV